MTSGAWIGLAAAIFLLCLYVAPLLFAAASSRAEAKRLTASGIEAEAEILGYQSIQGMWVQYQFTTVDGARQIQCNKQLVRGGKRLPIGTKTPVRYKAGYPDISVLVVYVESQAPS